MKSTTPTAQFCKVFAKQLHAIHGWTKVEEFFFIVLPLQRSFWTLEFVRRAECEILHWREVDQQPTQLLMPAPSAFTTQHIHHHSTSYTVHSITTYQKLEEAGYWSTSFSSSISFPLLQLLLYQRFIHSLPNSSFHLPLNPDKRYGEHDKLSNGSWRSTNVHGFRCMVDPFFFHTVDDVHLQSAIRKNDSQSQKLKGTKHKYSHELLWHQNWHILARQTHNNHSVSRL